MSRANRTNSGKSHWTDPAYKLLPQVRIITRKNLPTSCEEAERSLWPPPTPCQILLPSNLVQEEIAISRTMQVLCSPGRLGRSGSRQLQQCGIFLLFHRHWKLGWIWPGTGWNRVVQLNGSTSKPLPCTHFPTQWTLLSQLSQGATMDGKPTAMSCLIRKINFKVESYLDVPKEHNQLQCPNSQV